MTGIGQSLDREPYANNLRRRLPRIAFVRSAGLPTRSNPGSRSASGKSAATATFQPAAGRETRAPTPEDAAIFNACAAAGKKLAELHVGYGQQPEFLLHRRERPQSPLNWRVDKMRLSKDKSSLAYNDFLTLDGIPPETFEYRLGNRSALE